MARSLTVTPEEAPTASPLLIGFLLLAALVMTASAVSSASEAEAAQAPATTEAGVF